jgi:hypothetical protein
MNELLAILGALFSFLVPACAHAQQMADPAFHPTVAEPEFVSRHPRILFDEAHHNFHTLDGRYQAFGELMRADGFTTAPNRKPFSAESLAGADILVIANALGDDPATGTDSTVALSAFTADEIEVVYDWVSAGGALLLIADHAPFGSAAASLGERFGVNMSRGYTVDSLQAAGSGSPTIIQFTRQAETLGDHPIMVGRNERERINKVVAFTGQSLLGPAVSTPLMILSADAFDIPRRLSEIEGGRDAMMRVAVPARGRSMAVAMQLGKGRVVIQGEAAMLSAQVVEQPGQEPYRFGMNQAGLDNQQFALNEMRWLAGSLDRAR